MQFLNQYRGIKWLGYMSVHAGGKCFLHIFLIGIGTHGYDGQVFRIFAFKLPDRAALANVHTVGDICAFVISLRDSGTIRQ